MKVLMIAENHGVLPETQIGLLLARSGIEVRFIFRLGSTSGDFLRSQGMEVQELPLRGRLDFQSLRAIRTILTEFRPDVIHAYTAKTCWLAILAQWPGKMAKLVFYRGAMRPFSRFSPADWLVFYGRSVDVFECYSMAVQKDLQRQGISAERTMVNYYGHKLEWYAGATIPPEWANKKARFRIGCVANYRKVKGLEFLIAAADILLQKNVDFELFLVGRDENRMIFKCASRAASHDRITLTGRVPRPWGLIKTFDCLAVPSLQEAMGRVTIEALACGVPVVATSVGGLQEVIENGYNGMLVPPANAIGLAEAIALVLGDEQLRMKFRENGLRILREKFDLDRTRDRLLDLYRQLKGKLHDAS